MSYSKPTQLRFLQFARERTTKVRSRGHQCNADHVPPGKAQIKKCHRNKRRKRHHWRSALQREGFQQTHLLAGVISSCHQTPQRTSVFGFVCFPQSGELHNSRRRNIPKILPLRKANLLVPGQPKPKGVVALSGKPEAIGEKRNTCFSPARPMQ